MNRPLTPESVASSNAPHDAHSDSFDVPLDHPGWDELEAALEPDCETAGDPFHRHTAHCFGMDDPIRGEL